MEEHVRLTKPGRKRLFITISTLFSFLLGVPFWWKSTEVYRSPLPYEDIDSLATMVSSSSLALPCYLNVIFVSREEVLGTSQLEELFSGIESNILNLIGRNFSAKRGCETGFEIQVSFEATVTCLRVGNGFGFFARPCGMVRSGILDVVDVYDDFAMDEWLWKYFYENSSYEIGHAGHSGLENEGGRYTVVVINTEQTVGKEHCAESAGVGTRTSIGKYRHAWILGWTLSSPFSEVSEKIADLAVRYFRNGGIVGISTEAAPQDDNLPLSTDGEAILSFSLLNAEPTDWIFDWEFEELERRFLLPVVEALKYVAGLSVESQVLYFTPKAVQSHWVRGHNSYIVHAKQLPFFVNANEWHLDSSSAAAGRAKLLHFAIYVPAVNECPLQFQLSSGRLSSTNSFTSPGWGGVIVWNPPHCNGSFTNEKASIKLLSSKDFEPLAGIVAAQLRTLFGLTPIVEDTKACVFIVPANRKGFADWEVDVLVRKRARANVAAAASTLSSLARLVRNLPNMVIMDEIGEQVKNSMEAVVAAQISAVQGSYDKSAVAARKSRAQAETAFFQPSIMSLLYNPTEHHLAIYTPFFVPVLLHAVLAVLKEGARYRQELRKYKLGLQKKN